MMVSRSTAIGLISVDCVIATHGMPTAPQRIRTLPLRIFVIKGLKALTHGCLIAIYGCELAKYPFKPALCCNRQAEEE
jgi:hypothetical protein